MSDKNNKRREVGKVNKIHIFVRYEPNHDGTNIYEVECEPDASLRETLGWNEALRDAGFVGKALAQLSRERGYKITVKGSVEDDCAWIRFRAPGKKIRLDEGVFAAVKDMLLSAQSIAEQEREKYLRDHLYNKVTAEIVAAHPELPGNNVNVADLVRDIAQKLAEHSGKTLAF